MTQMTQWLAGCAAVGLVRMVCACDRRRVTQMTQRHAAACWRPGALGHDPNDPKLSVSCQHFCPPGRALSWPVQARRGCKNFFIFCKPATLHAHANTHGGWLLS